MPSLGYVGSATASTPLFYCLFNGQNGDGVYAIGAATRTGSTSGTWAEYASNPVLIHGSGWESAHVKDPCLIWDGSQYVLYYSGYNGSVYQIGRATATAHTGSWTKYASNPVVAVGAGGSVDEDGCSFPTVLYEPADTGLEWKMWYRAKDASGNLTVCYAHSSNGLAWTKVGKVLDVGAGGTWDDVGVLPGAIYKISSTYYLFYGGYQSASILHKWQGGYATFTSPTGTYTKYASNPTFLSRFNDSGTTVVPTTNIGIGDTQINLADTSPFSVGEPVILAMATSIAETFYIKTIDSSTLLTLDHATLSAYTGGGKVFRSFAYDSVIPRSVLSTATGYEAMGALFQPIDDLTQPATVLREGSFGWTQSVVTGNWTYSYVAGQGLFFPLYSSASAAAWHQYSAENPSVIAAP